MFFWFLLIAGFLLLKGGHETIKYHRTFWYAPNIFGFKDRDKRKSSKFLSYILGACSVIVGLLFILLAVKGIINQIDWVKR